MDDPQLEQLDDNALMSFCRNPAPIWEACC